MASSARYLAFQALRQIDRKDTFANIAVDQVLANTQVEPADRHLVTELVYGITRHRRTLDAIIEQFSRRAASEQPPVLRRVLQLGLYQLRYLDRIPDSAAVNSTVELARSCGLGPLTKVANGILRTYLRTPAEGVLPPLESTAADLAMRYSYPDWMVALWLDWLGAEEAESLCQWFNRSPTIDLRTNTTRMSPEDLRSKLETAGITTQVFDDVPGAIRLTKHVGAISSMPGYNDGFWSVQDASAQEVAQVLDPQAGELIVDCCAAPGGKSTHIAELMGDSGTLWALDRHAGRLRRVEENAKRLRLSSIQTQVIDLAAAGFETAIAAQGLPEVGECDRVLVDAPCSGLGTLHRHADARWRQKPETIAELVELQAGILDHAARWVKPGGRLVYSTCTIHPAENQEQMDRFLATHEDWHLDPEYPPQQNWPHRCDRDGFYIARLLKS